MKKILIIFTCVCLLVLMAPLTVFAEEPYILSVFPESGENKEAVEITITGAGFTTKSAVYLGDNILEPPVFISPNQLKVTVPAGLPAGKYHVRVQNPSDGSPVLQYGYTATVNGSYPEPALPALPLPPGVYKDTAKHWAVSEIELMGRKKVIKGYTDGLFKPNRLVTRAEFVVMLDRLLGWSPGKGSINKFKDAKTVDSWAHASLVKAVERGVLKGYKDGTIKPNQNITYQEVEWLIQRAFPKKKVTWKQIAGKISSEKGVLPASMLGQKYINRAEVTYLLAQVD